MQEERKRKKIQQRSKAKFFITVICSKIINKGIQKLIKNKKPAGCRFFEEVWTDDFLNCCWRNLAI